ncbi:sulfite exporter TauE/SafE family protein [Bacillus sp. 1P06AnD]|uniref:sulfite exporter TauE/SafE family protein n=1 Tax=Bacillus sp. 1P06AnD TaxID=3132208 RepID=UPI0039A2D3EE
MSIGFIAALFVIGFIGSFISGMVGVGGAIIMYPLLLYVVPMLGFPSFTAHEVSGISALQVVFSTLAGVWAYRKSEYLNKTLILYMGIAVLLGSFVGGFGSQQMPESAINFVYAILATIATVMMFIPKKGLDDLPADQVTFNKWLAAFLAFIVGIAGGIVGAAGSFILVPIMLVVLKIPTRMTIATSLAIAFISSVGTSVGKVMTGQVLYGPAIVLIIVSLIASQFGAKAGQKMNTKVLQAILAVLIMATAIKIWLGFF